MTLVLLSDISAVKEALIGEIEMSFEVSPVREVNEIDELEALPLS